jgi:lysyl-tRNA synthetase class II
VQALARNADGDWLLVSTPKGKGWVSAHYVELSGPINDLPVSIETFAAPFTPTPRPPADYLAELPKDGEYYVVTGADIDRLEKALEHRKIRVTGVIVEWRGCEDCGFFCFMHLETLDHQHRLAIDLVDEAPEDLCRAAVHKTIRKGDVITIWGFLGAFHRGVFMYSIIESVTRWEKH